MITMFKKACAAVLIGFAWAAVAAAPFGDSSTAFAGDTNTDTNHYALIRIGHGEPLPAFRNIVVGLNKSTVVEVPRDLRDVVVSNPAILDAVVQSSSRVYLIGKALGQGNVIFFDENGEQILTLEVRIEHDVQAFDRLIERVIPGAKVKSEVLNDTIVLTGSVPNPADAARVADIASRFIQSPGDANGRSPIKVVNLLKAEAKEQVLLKVQVAEVNRETIKRLGVNWNYGHVGDSALGFMTNNGFPVSNGTGSDQFLFGVTGPGDDLSQCLIPGAAAALAPVASVPAGANFNCLARTMQAFERNGLLKTLAEPNLTAISGETASFLAGGEFPVPVAVDAGTISVEWKPFGVGLSFTPMVLSEARISLKITTEVSELSTEGAIDVGSLSLPGLRVRRANTTVDLPSGGSLVIGGLISEDTRQNIDGVPGLKNLPILGTLFRSRDFRKEETELLIIVTPYMVNPVAMSALAKPIDGLIVPSDARANFLGQLNKVYGRTETLPEGSYEGNYGFIVE